MGLNTNPLNKMKTKICYSDVPVVVVVDAAVVAVEVVVVHANPCAVADDEVDAGAVDDVVVAVLAVAPP